MRVASVTVLLLAAATLPGCSGFSIGVRQDKEDREAFARALAAKDAGSFFAAGELLRKDWTRLFVFRGGIATQAVEDRIAIPFPQSGEATSAEASYLVFADEEEVVSAFSYAGPTRLTPRCFLAERVPFTPATELTLVAGGEGEPRKAPKLSTVAEVDRCR